MRSRRTSIEHVRTERTELENYYIEELEAGSLSRRAFIRKASVLGISAPAVAAILSACGGANNKTGSTARAAAPVKGGTLRVACAAPTSAINPLTISDPGGEVMLSQTGEFLILDSSLKGRLEPMLATRWTPNHDGSVWTFDIRKGVTFHNGAALTAADVAYTMRQLSDPHNASNALSSFEGVLTPAGVKQAGRYTLVFHLEAPNGNFPYLVSSDNYNAIIVPDGTDFGSWQTTFVGTGAFKLHSYTQNQGASFVANHHHWSGPPLLTGTQFTFYSSQDPQILALQGGTVDVITQFVPAGAQSLLHSSSFHIIRMPSSNHRELSMRNDIAPFTDARVRQAVALTLNRPAMVSALLAGYGHVGNDSPFGPRFASTNTNVPQRVQDLSKARELLQAAGHGNGFHATLYSEIYEELPSLAQVIKSDAAKVGMTLNLQVQAQSAYYGKATFGNSNWLDGEMSLVDYGDRGVPNVFLESPLTTNGPWNAARFHNKTYDALVNQYVAAVDLRSQRTIAGKIERLLLAQTPIIIPYWLDGLCASARGVGGLNPTATGQIFLARAYKTSS